MRSLVLCSGGIKSAFLAMECSKEGETILLFLAHGQYNEEREREAAVQVARLCDCELITKRIAGFPSSQAPLLRFLHYMFHAIPVARRYERELIYHGLSRDSFPPNTPANVVEEFIQGLQRLLELALPWYDFQGQWQKGIEFETPLRRLTTKHVLRLGSEWHIPWEFTWSCKGKRELHCGVCSKCRQRKIAFKRAGIKDLTSYYV